MQLNPSTLLPSPPHTGQAAPTPPLEPVNDVSSPPPRPPYSHYYPTLNIVPSSLRDILLVIFVLLSLPATVRLILVLFYLVVFDNLTNLHPLCKLHNGIKWHFIGLGLIKHGILNSMLYYVLNYVVYNKWLFNYMVILSKSIIANHIIGSTTFNFYNSISSKKTLTKDHYSSHFVNSMICFFMIVYINYICNWLEITRKFDFVNSWNCNDYKIQLYVILCLNIITNELYRKHDKPFFTVPSPATSSASISINCDTNKLLAVDIANVPGQTTFSTNIAYSNFHTFVFSPFKTKIIMLKRRLLPSLLSPYNDLTSSGYISNNIPATTTTTSVSHATSTSLTTTIKAPHITTVENTIVIQPFWSILAACKALWSNASVFEGNSTIHKNNGGKFIHSDIENIINMATVKIDDSKIILRFLDTSELNLSSASASSPNLKVKLNNINWSFFRLSQEDEKVYLIIYGLTPHFQYEIEIQNNDIIINRLIINTTSNNSAIIESIAESSSLLTLQTSLMSTRDNLCAFRNKFKKFKKEENKKVTEIKNNIYNLKGKISKYNNKPINDNRIFGKLKSLEHSVAQLEIEIEQLKLQIDELSNQEISDEKSFKQNEAKYLLEIGKLNEIMKQNETRISEKRKLLKQISVEHDNMKVKHGKLVNKQNSKIEEIKQLNVELKTFKKDIIYKLTKRIKKLHENYDQILPNVINATEQLNTEYEMLDSSEFDYHNPV